MYFFVPEYFLKDKIFYSGSILLGVKYSGVKYSVLNTVVAAASTVDTDGADACGNDARQAFLLEPLPCGLKQGHQQVSLNGHMVWLGWHPAHTGAFAP